MYDIYLTDVKIYHLLPTLLGKKFYEKKKYVWFTISTCAVWLDIITGTKFDENK